MSSSTLDGVLARRAEIEAALDPQRFTTLERMITDPQNKVVVGLGGGALRGLCGNLALMKILEELDLCRHVSEIWGTSAGAVIGGGWATGATAMEVLDLVRSLNRPGVLEVSKLRFALSILGNLWPFRRPLPEGLIRGGPFLETIAGGLKVDTFEECSTPFRCIACSADGRARRKVFRRGPLLPAIFSSMTVPGIVVPRPDHETGQSYYDGGLVEKSPLISPIADHMRSGDKRKLLLVCTHFDQEGLEIPDRGFYNRFLHSIYALEDLAWGYQLAEARSRPGVVLMLLNSRLNESSMFDFSRTDVNYLAAREVFANLLQNARIAQTFGLT